MFLKKDIVFIHRRLISNNFTTKSNCDKKSNQNTVSINNILMSFYEAKSVEIYSEVLIEKLKTSAFSTDEVSAFINCEFINV